MSEEVKNIFVPTKGSILMQVRNYYQNIKYVRLNSTDNTIIKEAVNNNIDHNSTEEWPIQGDGMPRNFTPSSVQSAIRRNYKNVLKGYRPRPIFIWGLPGIGKTEIVAKFCDESGLSLCILDFSAMIPDDLCVYDIEYIKKPEYNGRFRTIPGEVKNIQTPGAYLPKEEEYSSNGGILLLDELTNASERMFAFANKLISYGSIGNWHQPINWMIVCAGNRPSSYDNPNVINIANNSALLSKFFNINLKLN